MLASLLWLQAPLTPLSVGFLPSCLQLPGLSCNSLFLIIALTPGTVREVTDLPILCQEIPLVHTGVDFKKVQSTPTPGPAFALFMLPAQSHTVAWTRRVNTMLERNCSF